MFTSFACSPPFHVRHLFSMFASFTCLPPFHACLLRINGLETTCLKQPVRLLFMFASFGGEHIGGEHMFASKVGKHMFATTYNGKRDQGAS